MVSLNCNEVTLVDEDGKMQTGFVDEEYLSKKDIQKVDLSKAPLNISKDSTESFDETYVVSAKSGVWLRPNTKLDRNSEEAILLEPGTYVLGGDSTVISSDNHYLWRKVITLYNGKLIVEFIADEYLMNADFNKAKGEHFRVNSSILNLRSEPSAKSNRLTTLKKGTEVILVPNVGVETDDPIHDWFYVAVKGEDGINFGYAAATLYKENGDVINYLKSIDIEESVNEQEKEEKEKSEHTIKHSVVKQVNTKDVGGVTLKLREKPTTESPIVARIENGTLINTTEEDFDSALKSESVDGHKWLYVETAEGENGYVATEYLDDYTQTREKYQLINARFGPKSYQGYFGIDVNATLDPHVTAGSIGEILTQNHTYKNDPNFADGTVLKKPDFVSIKMGSSAQLSPFTIMQDRTDGSGKKYKPEDAYKKVLSIAKVCEQAEVPYGFYYYSMATTEEEAKKQREYIEGFYKYAGNLRYNILPLGYDVEQGRTESSHLPFRNMTFVEENGVVAFTELVNNDMNELRKIESKYSGAGVILYTDHNVLLKKGREEDKRLEGEIIDYSLLDEQNKKLWMVQNSKGHYNALERDNPEAIPNIMVRQSNVWTGENQISIKTKVKGNVPVDYDFIVKEVLEKYVHDRLGIDINNQYNEKSNEKER